MLVFPAAKINFGLNILSRRPDGYHEISSIFYPVGISDALEVTPAQGSSELLIHGLAVPGDTAENLVWKAWQLMQKRWALPDTEINLLKCIPMGGGIGGGSADAGFFLRLVNQYFSLGITDDDLEAIALQLGSDCPFFIRYRPALVSGRGEEMNAVPAFLKGYYLVLLYGDVHVSTAFAYSRVNPGHPGRPLTELWQDQGNWQEVKNDFEPVVFSLHPQLAEMKDSLYRSGAVYASLTGTGSCIYGLFRTIPDSLAYQPVWSGWL